MTEAQNAVAYLIGRLHGDADLRHHMLGTQAMALLCEAEAQRTGATAQAIADMIASRHARQGPSKLVQCRRDLADIHDLAADCLDRGCSRAEEALRAIQDRTEAHRD